jgi:hypothetical protein
MYAMEMKMTATTMCRMKMVKRLPTTLLLLVMSRLFLKGHRTTSLEGQNENVDQETAPQLEGTTDPEDEMLLDGIFRPCIYCTAPPVGPTLVMLGNA